MINLGEYHRVMEEIRRTLKLRTLCVEILLYGSNMEWFSQYEVRKHMLASDPSIISAMQELTEGGYVRIARQYSPGLSRKYVLSRKGRQLVINFNTMMKNV